MLLLYYLYLILRSNLLKQKIHNLTITFLYISICRLRYYCKTPDYKRYHEGCCCNITQPPACSWNRC